jgi:ADP-ribose pyrophosphatase YjhB (NUDIX family)
VPGTALVENVRRELVEETSMTGEVSSLQLLAAQDILRMDKHVVRLTYTGTTTDKNVQLDSDHTEYKWVSLEEMKTLKGLDEYVRKLLQKNILSL